MANIQIKDLVTVTPNADDLIPISQGGNTRKASVADIRGIVNNLTEGGEDKALSAEQGKLLNAQIQNKNSNDIDYITLEYGTLATTFTNAKSYSVNLTAKQLEVVYYTQEEINAMQTTTTTV